MNKIIIHYDKCNKKKKEQENDALSGFLIACKEVLLSLKKNGNSLEDNWKFLRSKGAWRSRLGK